MTRTELRAWWIDALHRYNGHSHECPLCVRHVDMAMAGDVVPRLTWQPLLDNMFAPGTRWQEARDWVLEGCVSGPIADGRGWHDDTAGIVGDVEEVDYPFDLPTDGGAA